MAERAQIVIDMGDLWLDEENVTQAILGIAAARLTDSIRENAGSELRARVRAITDDEIREAIRPVIEKAMPTLLQRTDSFGHPIGQPVSLADVIVETARKELGQPSDRYNREGGTVMQKILREEIQRALREELQKTLAQARSEVLAAVKDQGAQVLTETIARMGRT